MHCMSSLIVLGRLVTFTLATGPGHSGPRYLQSSIATLGSTSKEAGGYIAQGLSLPKSSSFAANRSLATSAVTANATYNDGDLDGHCWTSWSRYWSASTQLATSLTTFTTIEQFTAESFSSLDGSTTFPVTTTVTARNGNFATKTYITTYTTHDQMWATSNHSGTRTTQTQEQMAKMFPSLLPGITPPPCALPTYVPQCQAAWQQWFTSGAMTYADQRPVCTQAIVSGSMCSQVAETWLSRARANGGEIDGNIGNQWLPQTLNGTTSIPDSTTLYYWPSTSTLAPGCTLGCQSCRVSGSRVKLMYWPPATTTWRTGTSPAVTTVKASRIATVVTEGTTLTSPTVYISFDHLSASDSCSAVGTIKKNLIVAITNSATLSSLWGWDHYWGLQSTASFNFTDMYVTPVPDSIYMSQPRCASASNSIWYSCLPLYTRVPICSSIIKSGFHCDRSLPYEPVIAIPKEVAQLQPEWNNCIGGVLGVYDPPVALQAAAFVAAPTIGASTIPRTTEPAIVATFTAAAPSPAKATLASATRADPDSQHTPIPTDIGASGKTDQEAPSVSAQSSHPSDRTGTEADTTYVVGNIPQASWTGPETVDPASPASQHKADPSPTDALGVLTQTLPHTTFSLSVNTEHSQSSPSSLDLPVMETTAGDASTSASSSDALQTTKSPNADQASPSSSEGTKGSVNPSEGNRTEGDPSRGSSSDTVQSQAGANGSVAVSTSTSVPASHAPQGGLQSINAPSASQHEADPTSTDDLGVLTLAPEHTISSSAVDISYLASSTTSQDLPVIETAPAESSAKSLQLKVVASQRAILAATLPVFLSWGVRRVLV